MEGNFQIPLLLEKKSRLGLGENILGGTGGHVDAPFTLVASIATVESLDDFRLLTLSTFAHPASLITPITDGFVGLVAYCHRFDLATLETFLVLGRVSVTSHLIAVITDGFAGLVARVHRFDLATLETFLVLGRVPVTSHIIAVRTDGFAGFVAKVHRFDLATLETFLVRGRVFAIAVMTGGFAGLPVLMDGRLLSADTTSTFHGLTSFLVVGCFGKERIHKLAKFLKV